ncbi:hypothetical protein ACH492_22285 [Streptomyces sp. NPDC019443]|uniref:hypothetical protein n=1 Tax=Streptomyces sp. NPDC019443 TaxID=3365061 RepID=UPI0037B6B42E
MTKKKKSTAQKKARALQAETGMPYTAALAQVRAEEATHEEPDSEPCFGCGQPLTAETMVDHIAGHANGTIPTKPGWNDNAGASDA